MRLLLIPLALLIFLAAWMLLRTLKLQQKPDAVEPAVKCPIDHTRSAQHLSEAIQFKTVSKIHMLAEDLAPFEELHTWISRTYPLISQNLARTVINGHSLLFTWEGSDRSLKAALFNAHMDVVPVDEATLKEWKAEPFGGAIKDGFVWGRGALDMKSTLVCLLEAVEALLKEGYQPVRTLYLAFGHDEEIMGFNGSVKIVDHLKAKGVRLAALLDEGGMITQGSLAGVDAPVALIGNSEKGYLTMLLTANGAPGHSSRPPRQTAIGVIARAIALMDDAPMPFSLVQFLPTLKSMGYLLPFGLQFVVANAGLLKGLMIRRLAAKPETAALLHTTHAATMVAGGIKDNILPSTASARVNLRLLPGDSMESAFDHFRKVINDPRLKMTIDEKAGGWEASAVSSTATPAYRTLDLVIRQVFNNVATAPFVFLAATDSRYYQPICDQIFKFSPHLLTPQEQKSVHGINERISLDSLAGMDAFYYRLMRVWGDAGF